MADDGLTAGSLSKNDWTTLVDRIDSGTCTPFIGPGARIGVPDASEIAHGWAEKEFHYPTNEYLDLPKAARHLSVEHDVMRPKELICRLFNQQITPPDFGDPATIDDPHRILAELPFPIYITTNHDDFMWRALTAHRAREPRKEYCRWNQGIPAPARSAFDRGQPPATPANPVVFYLYGHTGCRESLVVTDDDYMEFLISVSKDQSTKTRRMIPSRIERAMTGSSLLLLGYRLDDWDFRVLFHLLLSYRQLGAMMHVAVQLAPVEGQSVNEQQELLNKHLEVYQTYLASYFQSKKLKIRVSLQTCQDFVIELRKHWKDSPHG